MVLDGMLDFEEKTLEVAFSLKGKATRRGVVINPKKVYSDINPLSGEWYKEFLNKGDYTSVKIKTHQGPGELAGNLANKFKITRAVHIGGMIALLDATLPEARRVLQYLKDHPLSFYDSPEEKMFTEGAFNPLFLGYAMGSAIRRR